MHDIVPLPERLETVVVKLHYRIQLYVCQDGIKTNPGMISMRRVRDYPSHREWIKVYLPLRSLSEIGCLAVHEGIRVFIRCGITVNNLCWS